MSIARKLTRGLISGSNPLAAAMSAANADALARGGKLFYNGAASTLTDYNKTTNTGTTDAVATDPLGMWLSREQPVLLGSELVTNGTFASNTTGWLAYNNATLSWVAGKMRITAPAGNQFGLSLTPITTVVGKLYKVTATITPISGLTIGCRIKKTDSSIGDNGNESYGINVTNAMGATTVSLYFVATATTSYICMMINDVSGIADIDDVSVKPANATAATQATAGNRPILTAQSNGIVAPVFGGGASNLSCSLPITGARTVIVAAVFNSTANNSLVMTDGATGGRTAMYYRKTAPDWGLTSGSSLISAPATPIVLGQPYVVEGVFSTTGEIWVNNSLIVSGALTVDNQATFIIGNSKDFLNAQVNGPVIMCAVIPGALTQAERAVYRTLANLLIAGL